MAQYHPVLPSSPSTAQYAPAHPSITQHGPVSPSSAQYHPAQLSSSQHIPVSPSISQYPPAQPIKAQYGPSTAQPSTTQHGPAHFQPSPTHFQPSPVQPIPSPVQPIPSPFPALPKHQEVQSGGTLGTLGDLVPKVLGATRAPSPCRGSQDSGGTPRTAWGGCGVQPNGGGEGERGQEWEK